MPNTQYDYGECDIESLIEFLDNNESYERPRYYFIQEYCPPKNCTSYAAKTYELYNLKMIVEHGLIISEDIEKKLKPMEDALQCFAVDDIEMIRFHKYDRMITISFSSSGYIRIFY